MTENTYIDKPRLLPQLCISLWRHGVSIYDKEASKDGLIMSTKYTYLNDNYEISYSFEINFYMITQHRLLKINNIYFEVVDLYYKGQNYGIINQINEDEYNNIENIKSNNDGKITEIIKEIAYDMINKIFYFFLVTIEYNETQSNQICYIDYHYSY